MCERHEDMAYLPCNYLTILTVRLNLEVCTHWVALGFRESLNLLKLYVELCIWAKIYREEVHNFNEFLIQNFRNLSLNHVLMSLIAIKHPRS